MNIDSICADCGEDFKADHWVDILCPDCEDAVRRAWDARYGKQRG